MDIFPYLIFRTEAGKAEFAQWATGTGDMAVALFQSKEEAESFISQAGLESSWTVLKPPLPLLHSILKAVFQGGIHFAVLSPGAASAKTIFPLEEVIRGGESWLSRKERITPG
ncbi:MAG: hypothetical protein EXR99_14890 [Gemmataceae bacterium]|nr:hypothetical protein [Gemmataceae bacterium]